MNAAAPLRLPRGRHGLTSEEVARIQRERLLRAMAEQMAEKGYASTSVADILRAAGVSRETFYQQFSSKQDCFMAAYEAAVEIVLARAGPDPRSADPPLQRFDAALGAYLDALASEPAFARLFLVEVYAAGPLALARRAEAQQRFVDGVAEIFKPRDGEDRFACETLVAAISAMVTARLAASDVDGLRALRAPLVALAARLFEG